jgi:hypothetical protein
VFLIFRQFAVLQQRKRTLNLNMQTKTPFDQASAMATSAAIAMAAVNQAVSMKTLEVPYHSCGTPAAIAPDLSCPFTRLCV